MTSADYYVLAALAAASALLWWSRRTPTGRLHYGRQLSRNQEKAWTALKEHGFTLVGGAAEAPFTMTVDGRSYEEKSRADLLVRRSGRTFLVLTGSDLREGRLNSLRRRQHLMALAWAFRPHGFLIYNPEKDTWREVRLSTPGMPAWIVPALVGVVLGFFVALRIVGSG